MFQMGVKENEFSDKRLVRDYYILKLRSNHLNYLKSTLSKVQILEVLYTDDGLLVNKLKG